MNKCLEEFCLDCGHHLYKNNGVFLCVECNVVIDNEDVKTLEEVRHLRERYDATTA